MATDLAINYTTGDLMVAPNGDFDIRTGPQTVEQRIRVRLRVIQGAWTLDPSNGTLGSRVREIFRLPTFRAVGELELAIREALEPMEDLSIQDIDVIQDPKKANSILAKITYSINDDGGGTDIETLTADFTTTE